MSKINTLSVFYYGLTVNKLNNVVNFDEGAGELSAFLSVDDYTLKEYADEIAIRMTLAGTQVYTATVNRATRKITISAPGNFSLLAGTGSQQASAIWSMAGFNFVDKTGTNSYESDFGAGFEYIPQLTLDDYTSLEDWEVKESAVVNVSTSGVVQTLQYGDGQRMSCRLRGATDLINLKVTPFYENANGVQALRNFMKYLITKAKIEFMPDKDSRSTFYNLLLESTDTDKNGIQFKIKNMKVADKFFECGPLVFRKVVE